MKATHTTETILTKNSNRTASEEQLSAPAAMVLMELEEAVEDDAVHLSRELNMSVGRIVQITTDLHKKGLIILRRVSGELYLSLSKKGKRMYASLWPQQLLSQ